ncbi:hypothetical protein DMN91_006957 [Ooceraea biroi]|uniref:Large ribosomal subunit protein bL9m n=1 Tax=Ooceraea biroi TaxID=2015173 RepID=A0A026VXX1_OOCBI|nr:39S ribosomal protein L9, mitochondrial [Ooceraea biroi]EZA48530.1 39S ribosomal protein L9, mitochondrial [Ooceraea biroi]RLU20349.1 hypothetical protein DMN91_006957 [Ooceraea biroi]
MLKFPKLLVNHVKMLAAPLPSQADCLLQQTRNTYILKRKYELPLHKKNQKPHRFKSRHYIYEVVDHQDKKKQKVLDLILTKFVSGIGNVGTRVSIPANVAYKSLLLPKLADYATPENVEKYMKLVETQEVESPFSSVTVENTMKYLTQLQVAVVMSKDVPWTLEKWHIRTHFRKVSVSVPEDAITMPEKPISGPNMDIEGKEFYVTLTINNREQIKVRCVIHHWATEKAARLFVPEFWKLPPEPIFPEDKPILDSLQSEANKLNESENKLS